MLFLLDKDVRTVKWNGIPLHEASSAIVKEETNGDFYLTVRYPITDSGIYQLIKEDMLIKAPAPVLGYQLFRIKKPIENDDSLEITAYHISDDIMKRSITPISLVGQGCAMALSQMVQNAKTDLGDFSFTSDIMDSRTFNTPETETLYSVLMDGKHSIVGTWEGELIRDNFALSIKRSRGADRGVVITTHKNLKSYQRTKNSQGVVTRIHARSTFKPDGAEDEVTLRVTVDSPLINSYPYINEKEYENNNAETVEDLRKWAEAKFTNEGIDKVSDAIEIEAYELDGQVVHLGDTVNLKSRKHSADLYKKAIAYEFNALTEEYISITFDDKPGVGGSGMSSGLSNAADAILGASATAQNVAIQRAVKNANAAFDAEFDKRAEKIYDGIEQAKADAEEYADKLKTEISQEFDTFDKEFQATKKSQDQQIADILAQAESAQSLAAQAKAIGDQAKADAVNLVSQLNTAKTALQNSIAEAKAQANTVANNLATAKSDLQNQVTAINAKAVKAQTDVTQAKSDLQTQASQINAQAAKQVELTKLTTDTKKLADGTLTSLNELSKTVDKNTGAITSVANRTKTVEDSLSGVKTNYTQLNQTVNAQTGQITSINQKTAQLESGINGVKERFENIRVGSRNILRGTKDMPLGSGTWFSGTWRKSGVGTIENVTVTDSPIPSISKGIKIATTENGAQIGFAQDNYKMVAGTYTQSIWIKGTAGAQMVLQPYWNNNSGLVQKRYTLDGTWQRLSFTVQIPAGVYSVGYVYIVNSPVGSEATIIANYMDASNLILDWSAAEEDFSNQIAEYKRTADQNYSGLQSTVQTLDGKITQNKSTSDQTAEAFKTRLSSLETFKNAEGTRAQAYFEAAKSETAKQITAERTAISQNYVAKSTYQEDAAGVTRRLTATETVANTVKTNLATYQETNDRRVAALETNKTSTDGRLTQLSNKVDQNAQQTRETISAVETKIPTVIGTTNLLRNGQFKNGESSWSRNGTNGGSYDLNHSQQNMSQSGMHFFGGGNGTTYFGVQQKVAVVLTTGTKVTVSVSVTKDDDGSNLQIGIHYRKANSIVSQAWQTIPKEIMTYRVYKRFYLTFELPTDVDELNFMFFGENGKHCNLYITDVKAAVSNLGSDWSPNPEEIATDISNTKLDIVKTADGLKLTANKVEGHDKSITQHTTQITALNNELSAKVSKKDYDALSGRLTSAETDIKVQAGEISKRLTSTQVESAIAAKGYQTKAQVDDNITGRGYITNSALQPYVTATVLENTVKETSSSFERRITQTEAKIPTENSGNLLLDSGVGWTNVHSKAYVLAENLVNGKTYTITSHFGNTSGSTGHTFSIGDGVWRRLNYDSTVDSWICTFTVSANVAKGTSVELAADPSTGLGSSSFVTLVKGSTPLSVWQPAFSELATVTAFNSVKDTVDAHKRIIGDGSNISSAIQSAKKFEQQIASGGEIYQAIATAKGLATTVSGTNGLSTQVSQLKESWSFKTLNSAGDIISQANLASNQFLLEAAKIRLKGKTLADEIQAIDGKFNKLFVADGTFSKLNADIIDAQAITGSKIKFDQSFFNNLTANDAYLKQLFAKNAFITQVQSVTIAGSQIVAGSITADKLAANAIDVGKITGNVANFVTNAINDDTTRILNITNEYISAIKKNSSSTNEIRIYPSDILFTNEKSDGILNSPSITSAYDKIAISKLAIGAVNGSSLANEATTIDGNVISYGGNMLKIRRRSYAEADSSSTINLIISEDPYDKNKMVVFPSKGDISNPNYNLRNKGYLQFNHDGSIELKVKNVYYTGELKKVTSF